MTAHRTRRARIAGTGSSLPQNVLTNRDLEKRVETNDEWIVTRTGIRERRIAPEGMVTSDLALDASEQALRAAGVRAKDLDLIVCATVTPDMVFPNCANVLGRRLGVPGLAAVDLSAACSGFLYALAFGSQAIEAGRAQRVLIVGAETLSRITNPKDRNTCILFGDGAGAALLVPAEDGRGVLSTHLHSDATGWEHLNVAGGGSAHPASKETIEKGLHAIRMNGREVFKVAVRALEQAAREALDENGFKPEDVRLFIPHQANLRIIQTTAERLGVPMERVYVNIDRYGNTSAASIPIALDEAVRVGRILEGDLLLLDAFGGGFTWASALLRW